MITAHHKHLEERCRQRGYKLADAMACVVKQDGDQWTVDVDHPAYPRSKKSSLKKKSDKEPSLAKRACKWAKAVAKWTAAGQPNRTDEEVNHLFSICKKCEHYSPKGKCRACGCAIGQGAWAITNKARMATEDCPKGKWPKEQE